MGDTKPKVTNVLPSGAQIDDEILLAIQSMEDTQGGFDSPPSWWHLRFLYDSVAGINRWAYLGGPDVRNTVSGGALNSNQSTWLGYGTAWNVPVSGDYKVEWGATFSPPASGGGDDCEVLLYIESSPSWVPLDTDTAFAVRATVGATRELTGRAHATRRLVSGDNFRLIYQTLGTGAPRAKFVQWSITPLWIDGV